MGRKKQKFQFDENGKYYKIVNGKKKYYEPLKLVDFFYDDVKIDSFSEKNKNE